MASRAEQIAAAERKAAEATKRVRQLKAAQEMAEARKLVSITKGQRSEDTRRKVLVGAMVLGQMEANAELGKQMTGALDSYLTRPDDRALFGLPAKEPQP